MDNSRTAPLVLQQRYRRQVQRLGRYRVARELGMSNNTIANLVAGFGLQPATLALVESKIDYIESVDAKARAPGEES